VIFTRKVAGEFCFIRAMMRAKAAVSTQIDTLGFFAIDLGLLGVYGRLFQFPGGPLPTHNLIKFD
jgi:hypothetical protein